jgi:alcohol dehydrogenase class IV
VSSYHNPVRIVKTDDWKKELTANINDLKLNNPIIVTTHGNRKRLQLDEIFDPSNIFSDVYSNPIFENCKNAISFCQKNSFDGVIALGGGSAMDLAKVVMAHLCLGKTEIFHLIKYKDPYPQEIPSIFLPTTHGTGSEVTMWGTVWNMKEKKKYSISNTSLYPSIAILDGALTQSLPLDISIITIMDALSHSMEAIWNKNSNNKSTSYAIMAITEILKNIESLKKNPQSIRIRNVLLNAATTSGLAFSNTATAAAHSISYPLTIHYGIPHGVASSIPLVPLLKINSKKILDPLKKIYYNLQLSNLEDLITKIRLAPQNIISYKLRDWGVKRDELDLIVEQSFTKGRMDNNIIQLSNNNVRSILEEIF